jgi:hypothetical protein
MKDTPIFTKTIDEALKEGLCEKCVSYYEGEIRPPWTTHCYSTLGRTLYNQGKCTRLANLK